MEAKQTAVEWLIEQFSSKEFMYKDRTNIIEQAKEIEKNNKTKFKIKVFKNDEIDAFGAYASPSIKKNDFGIVLFNVEANLITSLEEDITFKEMFIETIMHEVGHALEEFYDLEFNEERIDNIIDSYRNKYIKQ